MAQNQGTAKASYQSPELEVIYFSYVGTLTPSGNADENEGEWDPLLAADDEN